MMIQTVAEARELVVFAARFLDTSLVLAAARLEPEGREEERAWLDAARRRVSPETERTKGALAQALALPECEPERRARGEELLLAWVAALEALATGLAAQTGPRGPLIEVLFPHQNFDKLRRGGAQTKAFATEFERRRTSSYVRRLSGEPEYASFLPPLLDAVDEARRALDENEEPPPLGEDQLAALRRTVLEPASALCRALDQGKHLVLAALAGTPDLANELELDPKRRKRSKA